MKILTVVGKIDSRALVYPLARALSLSGLTGIITDDGSYRRLFPGKGSTGTVSGVDVSVGAIMDESLIHSLDDSGIRYDYLIVVANDYIYPKSTGIIVCHGLDRSMLAVEETDEDDDFIIPGKPVTVEPVEAAKAKKGFGFGKAKQTEPSGTVDQPADTTTNPTETASYTNPDKETKPEEPVETDRILVPENIPFEEVQIAFTAAPKKGIAGISLKEGLYSYVYTCEEAKKLGIITDKVYNGTLAKIAAKPLGMQETELKVLLAKEEGKGSIEKGKKK